MGDLRDIRQNNQNSEDNSLFNQELVPELTTNIQNVFNEDEPTQEDLAFYIDQYIEKAKIDDEQLEEYLETIYPNPEKAPFIVFDPRLYVLVEILSRTEEGIELLTSIQQTEIYPTSDLQTVVFDIFKKRILEYTYKFIPVPTDGLTDKQREKKRVQKLLEFIEDKNDKYGDDYLLTKLAERELISYPQRFILFVTAYNRVPTERLNENVIGSMGWIESFNDYSKATENIEGMISSGSHRLGIEYLNAILSTPIIRGFELDKRDIYNFYTYRYAQEIDNIIEKKGVQEAEAYFNSINDLLGYTLVSNIGEQLSILLPYTLKELIENEKYEMLDSVVKDLQYTSLLPGMIDRESIIVGVVSDFCNCKITEMVENESFEELSELLEKLEQSKVIRSFKPRDYAFQRVYRKVSNFLRDGFYNDSISLIEDIEKLEVLRKRDISTLRDMYERYTYKECESRISLLLENGAYSDIKYTLEEDPYYLDLPLSESQRMNLRAYVHGQITIKCQKLLSEGKSRDAFELLKTTKTLGLYIDIDEELKKASFN